MSAYEHNVSLAGLLSWPLSDGWYTSPNGVRVKHATTIEEGVNLSMGGTATFGDLLVIGEGDNQYLTYIGDGASLGAGTVFYGWLGVVQDNVSVGERCHLGGYNSPINLQEGAIVGDGCKLKGGTCWGTIGNNVTIGDYMIIEAGAVIGAS